MTGISYPTNASIEFAPFSLQTAKPYTLTASVGLKNYLNTYTTIPASVSFSLTSSPLSLTVAAPTGPFDIRLPLSFDASASRDPDTLDQSKLIFTWTCSLSNGAFCKDQKGVAILSQTGKTFSYPGNTFPSGIFTIKVTMTSSVSGDTRLKISSWTLVGNLPTTPAVTDFTIMETSNQVQVNPTQACTLISTVVSNSPSTLIYSWKTSPLASFSGDGTNTLVFSPGSLTPGQTYTVTLTVTDSFGSSSRTYSLPVNNPPHAGAYTASPTSGFGYQTTFTLNNANWVSANTPLQYRYGYATSLTNLQIGNIVYFSETFNSSLTTSVQIPNPSTSTAMYYLVTIIQDSLGCQVQASTSITLKSYYPTDSTTLTDNINNVLQNTYTDPAKAVNDVQVAVSMINTNNLGTPTQAESTVTRLVNTLLDSVSTTSNSQVFLQSVSVLNTLSSTKGTVSAKNAETVTNYLKDQLSKSNIQSLMSSTQSVTSVLNLVANLLSITVSTKDSKTTVSDELLELIDKLAIEFADSLPADIQKTISTNGVKIVAEKTYQKKPFYYKTQSTDNAKNQFEMSFEGTDPSKTKSGYLKTIFKLWDFDPFASKQDTNLQSNVVSLTYYDGKDEYSLQNLQKPLQLLIILDLNQYDLTKLKPDCQYWDKTVNSWSVLGMTQSKVANISGSPNLVGIVCLSNHLTDFSLGEQFSDLIAKSSFSDLTKWDGFANFTLSRVKTVWIMVSLFFAMLLLMMYGRSKDKESVQLSSNNMVKKKEIIDIGIKLKTKDRDASSDTTRGLEIVSASGSRSTKVNLQTEEKKTTLDKFFHALKTSHNFFSIFLRRDKKISRPVRFMLYFLRWYGVLTTTTLFFQALSMKEFNLFQVIIVSLISFILVTPITLLLTCLFTYMPPSSKFKSQVMEYKRKFNRRWRLGLVLSGLYFIGAVLCILLVCVNNSEEFNGGLVKAFLIQVGQDMLINQMMIVVMNFFLLMMIAKKKCNCCRKTMMKIIDNNLFIAFR